MSRRKKKSKPNRPAGRVRGAWYDLAQATNQKPVDLHTVDAAVRGLMAAVAPYILAAVLITIASLWVVLAL